MVTPNVDITADALSTFTRLHGPSDPPLACERTLLFHPHRLGRGAFRVSSSACRSEYVCRSDRLLLSAAWRPRPPRSFDTRRSAIAGRQAAPRLAASPRSLSPLGRAASSCTPTPSHAFGIPPWAGCVQHQPTPPRTTRARKPARVKYGKEASMHVMEQVIQIRSIATGFGGFIQRGKRASIAVAIAPPLRRLLLRRMAQRLHRR